MEKLIIVGTGTNGRHVYEFVKMYKLFDIIGFAVDEKYITEKSFKGLPVYPLEKLNDYVNKNEVKLFVALLWNHLNGDRKYLFERLRSEGYSFANIISPTAIIRGEIKGSNVWVHDNVIIQNDTVIEDNVAIMAMTLIGADSHVYSHCFFGAKSLLGGGSIVGEQTFVGINCIIFDGTIVGKKCILGACTAVKRNVPDFSLYKTSSDMVIKQYGEEEIENKLIYSLNKR